MARIAFINPSYGPGRYSRASRSPSVAKSGTIYYPFWLCYAAGWAEKRGHSVAIIDAAAKGLSHRDVIGHLDGRPLDLAVIDTTTPSITSDLSLAAMVREARPRARIMAVGTHASALPEEVLRSGPALDAVARGEYDLTVSEYAEKSEDPAGVAGITWRDGDAIRTNPDGGPMQDLDSLPFVTEVYKNHLDVNDYFWSTGLHPMVMVITGRGCPNRCQWCLYPQTMHGRRYRYRSPENVVDELDYIRRELPQVREIGIEDDTFTARRSRARAICELVLERGLKLRWWANVRADLDFETMAVMKRAGCRLFIVGFEAGTQKVLDSMHKGIRLDQAEQFMANARKLRVSVRACFVVGQLGETADDMQQTLDRAIKLNPETAQFFPMIPYPGTETYRIAQQEGMLATEDFSEWLKPEGTHNCVLQTESLSQQQVNSFVDEATRRFYLRPSMVLKTMWHATTSYQEARRTLKSMKRFWRFLLR